ncbi:MAG: hypothetical protein ACP5VQ_01035 [Phycisphaerae bacterium]
MRRWLLILAGIVVLVPLVMVGLVLTVAAIVAVLVLGLLSLLVLAVRRIGHKPAAHAGQTPLQQSGLRDDGRRNVRVVQRTNWDL